jgi:hypothetical protein
MLNFSRSLEEKDEVELTDGQLEAANGGHWHGHGGHHFGGFRHGGFYGPSFGLLGGGLGLLGGYGYGLAAPTVVVEPAPVIQAGGVLGAPAVVPVATTGFAPGC